MPVDKAKIIANKLDNIGISKFAIIYEVQPEPPADQNQYLEDPNAQN